MQGFTYVFRGTPLYIQLLIFYTGIYSIAAVREQPLLNGFFREALNCTLLAFAANAGPTPRKYWRAPFVRCLTVKSKPHGPWGFDGWKLYVHLIMPSALRRSLPYYSNEVIFMLHSTTLAFTATVPDIPELPGMPAPPPS